MAEVATSRNPEIANFVAEAQALETQSQTVREESQKLRAVSQELRKRSEQLLFSVPRRIFGGSPRQPDLDALRALVRLRLADGRLFSIDGHVWAGTGTGRDCVVCSTAVNGGEVEYEVTGPSGTVSAHFACYIVWNQESKARGVRE